MAIININTDSYMCSLFFWAKQQNDGKIYEWKQIALLVRLQTEYQQVLNRYTDKIHTQLLPMMTTMTLIERYVIYQPIFI